jgi:AcrR family transcriptional regulator
MSNEPTERSTKERLIEAAGKLFAEKRFKDTTVRDICELAGANVAAVNYYFGDKVKLHEEVISYIVNKIRELPIESILEKIDSPEDRLHELVRIMLLHRFSPKPSEWEGKLFAQHMIESNGLVRSHIIERIGKVQTIMMQIVSELLGPNATPEMIKLCSFSIISQFIFYFAMHAPHSPMPEESKIEMTSEAIDTIARHIADFSVAGIKRIKNR